MSRTVLGEAGGVIPLVYSPDEPSTTALILDESSIAAFNVKAVFQAKIEDDNNIWVKVTTKAPVPSSAGSNSQFYATEGNNTTVALAVPSPRFGSPFEGMRWVAF